MFENFAVRVLVAIVSASLLGAISGCNTVEGLGKDIQQGGNAIKREAQEVKKKL